MNITLRPLAPHDSLDALTTLLHRAYAGLGAMGLNYTAVDQTVDVTRHRIGAGQCQVAERAGVIVGTVIAKGPHDVRRDPWAAATDWYVRPDSASFAQLGVDPALHGQRIGQRLIAWCEHWAREHGYRWLALDTAVPATHLRALYTRLGFRDVDEVQWDGKRYRSTIMAKEL